MKIRGLREVEYGWGVLTLPPAFIASFAFTMLSGLFIIAVGAWTPIILEHSSFDINIFNLDVRVFSLLWGFVIMTLGNAFMTYSLMRVVGAGYEGDRTKYQLLIKKIEQHPLILDYGLKRRLWKRNDKKCTRYTLKKYGIWMNVNLSEDVGDEGIGFDIIFYKEKYRKELGALFKTFNSIMRSLKCQEKSTDLVWTISFFPSSNKQLKMK